MVFSDPEFTFIEIFDSLFVKPNDINNTISILPKHILPIPIL